MSRGDQALEVAAAEIEVHARRLEAQTRWMDWQEALRKVDEAEHRLAAVRNEPSLRPRREG